MDGGGPRRTQTGDDGTSRNDGASAQAPDPRSMSRNEARKRFVEARMNQIQTIQASLPKYQPLAHEQILRQFNGRDLVPWYSFTPIKVMQRMMARNVAGLSGLCGRALDESEARAVGENLVATMSTRSIWSGITSTVALFLAFRKPGAATFRFPFYQPRYNFRWSPLRSTSVVYQWFWHFLRFAAYSTVVDLSIGNPVYFLIISNGQRRMMEDERLRDVFSTPGVHPGVLENFPWPPRTKEPQRAPYSRDGPEEQASEQEQGQCDRQQQSEMSNYDAESTWSQSQRSPPQRDVPAEQPQQNDAWDAPSDDLDDASPVAQPARAQASRSGHPARSSWASIRQQTQQSQPQSSQARQRPSGGWADNSGTSPEYRGPQEGYTYSAADADKATPKDQAQQDFDKLLEKERHGVDQDRSSWSRK